MKPFTGLRIHRGEYQHNQTLGMFDVVIDGDVVFSGVTLEPPWRENQPMVSCIKAGIYRAKERETSASRFKYRHIHIQDVDGRSMILGHAGTYYRDTLGCILFGDRFVDVDRDGSLDVVNSRKTLQRIVDLLPDEFIVEIVGVF